MLKGFSTMDDPSPPKPKRWWITRKLRRWLISIKDLLIYQTGMYHNPYYSFDHYLCADGMLKKPSQISKIWTERWDSLWGRWVKL